MPIINNQGSPFNRAGAPVQNMFVQPPQVNPEELRRLLGERWREWANTYRIVTLNLPGMPTINPAPQPSSPVNLISSSPPPVQPQPTQTVTQAVTPISTPPPPVMITTQQQMPTRWREVLSVQPPQNVTVPTTPIISTPPPPPPRVVTEEGSLVPAPRRTSPMIIRLM